MIDFSNALMYVKYFRKVIYLNYLKEIKNLDYTGRIETKDTFLHGYEGCYPVNSLMKKLKITQEDSIIDIGCGKGLFLYYASKYSFNKIDGIEYSAELTSIASKNAKVLNNRKIHIYHCDARCFDKYDQYNYFFINNPFSCEIMKEVVVEILKSYYVKKRKIFIIYQFPFNQKVFTMYGFNIEYEKFPNLILTFG